MTSLPYWLASVAAAFVMSTAPLLDEPTEPELAQQVADDTQQAITDAQVAMKGER